jgi:ubiquinone/menaquinone biosynthesis C-methylase UbiE/uncharacterized protein YbaR (Trm112 family)
MKQSIDNKLGEINFRKKISEQQIENKEHFKDEFNSVEIESILLERMKDTFSKIKALKDKGLEISPFLEIGAERGQRSLVLENDLNGSGAALDLSFDMLKSCAYYSNKFAKKKIPLRICTDAYNLPFKSNSLPFVYCFQTLHHFPDPTPIIEEIYRVLNAGGTFLFDEEPYKKVLHYDLYKKKNKIYSSEEKGRNLILKVLDHFFAEETCNEVDYGVLENEKISLKTWKNALSKFTDNDVSLSYAKSFSTNLYKNVDYFKRTAAYLTGGYISGTCRKPGDFKKSINKITDAIICPSCNAEYNEILLVQEKTSFNCSECSRIYPIIDGVVLLFKDDLFLKLYPEYFKKGE